MSFKMKNRHLALIIYEEREKRNLTQEHLAQLAEVSPRTIQRLESDGTHSKETLMAVAEALEVDCKELLQSARNRASNDTKRNSRRTIPKDVRFEVFKRDLFSCQHCGASAPEALLDLVYIHPLADGGDNSIANLTTYCSACKSAIRDRAPDHLTAANKKPNLREELRARREQLDMMMVWKVGLRDTFCNQSIVCVLTGKVSRLPGRSTTTDGKNCSVGSEHSRSTRSYMGWT